MYKTVKLGSIKAESYLGGSVPVQKAVTKPSGPNRRGRSQDGPVMVHDEEACHRYSGGRRVGLTVVRASGPLAKHESLVSVGPPKSHIRLLSSATRVLGGVTWRKWRLTHTGEVPRRLCFLSRVRTAYKVHPKWPSYAMVKRRPP